jgi:hypothetical protein
MKLLYNMIMLKLYIYQNLIYQNFDILKFGIKLIYV